MSDNEEEILIRQQSILETFFDFLGRFNYDKAKEFLEREREIAMKICHITPFFNTVLLTFCQLASAEKSYANLIYLGPKGFLRKDSTLKSMYESLKTEFHRFEDKRYITPVVTPTMSPTLSSRTPSPPSITPSPSLSEASGSALSSLSISSSVFGNFIHPLPLSPGSDILDNLACHLCGQLLHFVIERLKMMELYEFMCSMSTSRFINFDQLLENITDIVRSTQKLFHHPLLSSLKSSFSSECEILMKLVEGQVHMQNWRFLQSLLCLHEAHTKLAQWATIPKEIKRGSSVTSGSRTSSQPAIYLWLSNLKSSLMSKFTLYFHENLSKQTVPQEMKNLCSKSPADYFQKIVSFQKTRSDVVCVAIVLDTNGLDDYRGHGYVYPDKYYEKPKGINSYPAAVCIPPGLPVAHFPGVVMIIDKEENKGPKNSDEIAFFYDKRMNSTYFLSKVETCITLVMIVEGKKPERDTVITRFMNMLCFQLRCNKIFASLKPGSK